MTNPPLDPQGRNKIEIKLVHGEWVWLGRLTPIQLLKLTDYAGKLSDENDNQDDFTTVEDFLGDTDDSANTATSQRASKKGTPNDKDIR